MTGGTGKQIRLSRLFSNRDGRAVVFAFDHGMQVGPVPGAVDQRAGVALAVVGSSGGLLLVIPAFQMIRTDTVAVATIFARRSVIALARELRNAARPKTKSGVKETKKRFPKEEIPAQSS